MNGRDKENITNKLKYLHMFDFDPSSAEGKKIIAIDGIIDAQTIMGDKLVTAGKTYPDLIALGNKVQDQLSATSKSVATLAEQKPISDTAKESIKNQIAISDTSFKAFQAQLKSKAKDLAIPPITQTNLDTLERAISELSTKDVKDGATQFLNSFKKTKQGIVNLHGTVTGLKNDLGKILETCNAYQSRFKALSAVLDGKAPGKVVTPSFMHSNDAAKAKADAADLKARAPAAGNATNVKQNKA